MRISTGNFQNLNYFSHFLFSGPMSRILCFIFHKVIRWITPILILISFLCTFILFFQFSGTYKILLGMFVMTFFLLPIADRALKYINVRIPILRNISYFVVMNFALFRGFIQYCKGVRSGVWQPTSRN